MFRCCFCIKFGVLSSCYSSSRVAVWLAVRFLNFSINFDLFPLSLGPLPFIWELGYIFWWCREVRVALIYCFAWFVWYIARGLIPACPEATKFTKGSLKVLIPANLPWYWARGGTTFTFSSPDCGEALNLRLYSDLKCCSPTVSSRYYLVLWPTGLFSLGMGLSPL